MLPMVSAAPPELVSVTVCWVLCEPIKTLPKPTLGGVMVSSAGAMPAPAKGMLCGEFAPLSVSKSAAAAGPDAVGTKLTVSWQLAPAATVDPHVLVSENSDAFAPASETPLIVSGDSPVLVTVTVCAVTLVPMTMLPKFRLGGESDAVAGVMPVPLSGTVCGDFAELSVMTSEAPMDVPAVGAKVTPTLQVAP